MVRLTDLEIQKKQILKAVRANIRLKYSLMADEELNRKLPEIEDEIEKAIREKGIYELDIASVLKN